LSQQFLNVWRWATGARPDAVREAAFVAWLMALDDAESDAEGFLRAAENCERIEGP
jgi:hypothetical protein